MVHIRPASDADWPSLWPIISAVLAAGDTYMLPKDTSESEARSYWMGDGVMTFVAEREGEVMGTYAMRANQRGRGAHVANAGYMVSPDCAGQGIGAAMGEHSLREALRETGHRREF